MLLDTQEPQLVAVAPMAGGTYKLGDPFTVSLIFDEIVDSVNSIHIKNVQVNTTWAPPSMPAAPIPTSSISRAR